MKPKTVVLIDDDSDDLDVMKEALQKVDSSLFCISFLYPDEALRLLSKESVLLPDYIFIDINMPRINGMECLKTLRAIHEFAHIPIIVYSTSMPAEVSKAYLAQGATYTFQKPYTVTDYILILEAIIYKSGFHQLVQSSQPLAR